MDTPAEGGVMVKVRMHRGLLDESMETASEINNRAELIAYLNHHHGWIGPAYTDKQMTVEPYSGPDDRIGWKDTWIICIDGRAVGMTDGPVPADEEAT